MRPQLGKLQNIYTLEKLSGDDLNHLYEKDTPVWKKVEEKIYKKNYPLIRYLIEGFNFEPFIQESYSILVYFET